MALYFTKIPPKAIKTAVVASPPPPAPPAPTSSQKQAPKTSAVLDAALNALLKEPVTSKPPPWEPEVGLLAALRTFAETGRPLLIINNKTGAAYEVKSYDRATGLVNLIGPSKQKLTPKIRDSEETLYHARWR